MKNVITVVLAIMVLLSCKTVKKSQSEGLALSEAAVTIKKADWVYLFDGSGTEGWRAYNGESLPAQWYIDDGALTFDTEKRLETDKKGGNDIIYAAKEFDNFELSLEWKLPEGGNSGIFYHIQEGEWGMSGIAPEYQLLDDLRWEEINEATLEDWQKTGADYAMYSPDEQQKIVKPAGEWNTSRIVFTPKRVEHWLNGKMIVSFVPWTDDWEKRKAEGKWKDFPEYGTFKKGYIGLQDHDSPLWFKNIKIREI